jgi:hypothetical protein
MAVQSPNFIRLNERDLFIKNQITAKPMETINRKNTLLPES